MAEKVVHVVDDDDAARDSLVFLLRSAEFSARSYDSAVSFCASLDGAEPGCVITDVRMPDMTGIELLRHIKASKQPLPVIVITGHGDVPLAVEAMKAGAIDFLEKPFEDDRIIKAVRAAFNQRQTAAGITGQNAEIARRLQTLSARERDVLQGLMNGLPNKTIGYDLGISPRTVEVYRANLMTKMGASSFSELVRMAVIGEMAGLDDR